MPLREEESTSTKATIHTTLSDELVFTPPNEAPAQRIPMSGLQPTTNTVVELHDDGPIPDIFKAKKKAGLSHIRLPENGVECVVDGVARWKCQRCRLIL